MSLAKYRYTPGRVYLSVVVTRQIESLRSEAERKRGKLVSGTI
jgi:hypothetical protein